MENFCSRFFCCCASEDGERKKHVLYITIPKPILAYIFLCNRFPPNMKEKQRTASATEWRNNNNKNGNCGMKWWFFFCCLKTVKRYLCYRHCMRVPTRGLLAIFCYNIWEIGTSNLLTKPVADYFFYYTKFNRSRNCCAVHSLKTESIE